MKKLLLNVLLLTSLPLFSNTYYSCDINYYDKESMNDSGFASSFLIQLDGSEKNSKVLLSDGKWVSLQLNTFQRNDVDIASYGEYQLNAFVYDEINSVDSLIQASSSVFIGLDQVISNSAGDFRLKNLLSVVCHKI